MHARTHATACAQRYVLVLFRNRQRGQNSRVHTRAPHAHMHTGDRTRELVQGTACSLVAAIGRLQELARSGLDLCGASSARQRRAGSVKQASLSLRRLLRCTRHRTWGTPTVLSSCSASTSRSHMPGSSTRSREVRFIATWRGAEQFVVCQAGPKEGAKRPRERDVGPMAELSKRDQGLRGLCSSAPAVHTGRGMPVCIVAPAFALSRFGKQSAAGLVRSPWCVRASWRVQGRADVLLVLLLLRRLRSRFR